MPGYTTVYRIINYITGLACHKSMDFEQDDVPISSHMYTVYYFSLHHT